MQTTAALRKDLHASFANDHREPTDNPFRIQYSLREWFVFFSLIVLATYTLAQLESRAARQCGFFLMTVLPWAGIVLLVPRLCQNNRRLALLECLARAASLCVVGLLAASIDWPVSLTMSLEQGARLALEVIQLNLFFFFVGVLAGGMVGFFTLPVVSLLGRFERNGSAKMLLIILPWSCLGFSVAVSLSNYYVEITGKSIASQAWILLAFALSAIGIGWLKTPKRCST